MDKKDVHKPLHVQVAEKVIEAMAGPGRGASEILQFIAINVQLHLRRPQRFQ